MERCGLRNPGSGAGKGKNTASETPMLRRAPTTCRLLGDSTNQSRAIAMAEAEASIRFQVISVPEEAEVWIAWT